jgi:hypothetical protein
VSDVVNPTFIKRLIIATVRITNSIIKSKLSTEFVKYINVFDIEKAGVLAAHNKNKYAINLNGNKLFFGPLYNLSTKKLKILRTYLNAALTKKWIRRSTSLVRASVLFFLKKDGSLKLCVNYRDLNKITIKDRCSLSLINETLDRLIGAAYYTKLNLKNTYYKIRIKAGDE